MSTNEQVTTRTSLGEACLTEVMPEVRRSKRSAQATGEAVVGRIDVPMDMALEMAMAGTHIAMETSCEDTH